jgi:hypothetical protein
MKTMRKILVFLGITQKKMNERGFEGHRLNPYNPLSYITLIIALVVLGLYGFIGGVLGILSKNPFKYQ